MIETNIPEINVDELMEKIRAEVRLRRERGGTLHRTVPRANDAPPSRLYAGIDPSKIQAMPDPEPFEYKEQGYHINDFLKYHDQQFVINAYQGILRRGSDSEGLRHFLESLRSGKMTKAEVLGRLRYAAEGRARKVKIKGLFWNFVIHSSFRIPVLGYFSRLSVGIVNLPVIVRNLQILEESAFAQLQQQRDDLNDSLGKLGRAADRKADRAELSGLKGEFDALLDEKADKVDLAELGDRKANRDELSGLKGEVEALLGEKAGKEQIEIITDKIREISRQTQDHKLNIIDQRRRLRMLLEEVRKRLLEPISTEQIQNMLKEEDHMPDAMYASFEEQFRGSREDIKNRLSFYLPYMDKVQAGTEDSPILDLGCGRGEWLELCKENGLTARGVDKNGIMVMQCLEFGFDVIDADTIEFLLEQKANSHGAVTGFHIIEHLSLNVLIALFDEVLRVVKPGGIIVFETPNPQNLIVGGCNFYTDPSHRNPIPSHTLKFLLEASGFIGIERVSHEVEEVELDQPYLKSFFNNWINLPPDYAIIGRKA